MGRISKNESSRRTMSWGSASDCVTSVDTGSDASLVIHVDMRPPKSDLAPHTMDVDDFFAEFKGDKEHQERVSAARVELADKLPTDGRSPLATMRLRQGLSQAGLAEKLGTSQSRISRLESFMEEPGIRFAGRLAVALAVSLEDIWRLFDDQPNGGNGKRSAGRGAQRKVRAAG